MLFNMFKETIPYCVYEHLNYLLHFNLKKKNLGKSVLQFPVSVSSTPAGTDESIAEFLVHLEENSPNVGKVVNK